VNDGLQSVLEIRIMLDLGLLVKFWTLERAMAVCSAIFSASDNNKILSPSKNQVSKNPSFTPMEVLMYRL
jgi:hypothetical protein